MEHQQWETQFVYLKDKSQAINVKTNVASTKKSNNIKPNNENSKDKKFLLAISGGVDSMVLLELFKNTKLNFCVANCNFNLRKDSNKEVELVNNYCNKFKIDFHTVIFDTKSFMIENSVAVQEAARELRYNYFSELNYKIW